ncbi:hypothetical protein ACVWWO_007454 [Bradyrhizobium sp. F1.13.1]
MSQSHNKSRHNASKVARATTHKRTSAKQYAWDASVEVIAGLTAAKLNARLKPAVNVKRGTGCKPGKKDCRDEQPGGDSKAGALPSDGKLKLEDFALYADRTLKLGECSRVEGGDLGVRSHAETAEAQLRIGRKAWIDPRRIISAHSVTVGEGVTFGLVAAVHFQENGIVLAPPAAFPAAGMPPLPLANGGGSKPDIEVKQNEALALAPGEYGVLSVDGVLVLNPGHYRVSAVRMGEGARLLAIVGAVRLDIRGSLRVGRRAEIRSDFDLSARHMEINVAGEDEGGTPAASFGDASSVRALIVAPHGSLNFADRVKARGAFAAFDLAAGEHVQVTFEDGFRYSDPQHGTQQLTGYFIPAIRDAELVGPVPRTQIISLAVGLPSRDTTALRQGAHGRLRSGKRLISQAPDAQPIRDHLWCYSARLSGGGELGECSWPHCYENIP